jgi:hypothetical protein
MVQLRPARAGCAARSATERTATIWRILFIIFQKDYHFPVKPKCATGHRERI